MGNPKCFEALARTGVDPRLVLWYCRPRALGEVRPRVREGLT